MANTNKNIEIIKALPLTKDEFQWIEQFARKTFRSHSDVLRLSIATLRSTVDDEYDSSGFLANKENA